MARMPIRLTRWAQSCVRIEGPDGALVIDPGVYGESATVLAGAESVLLTHDHADHVDGAAVAASGLPVWGPAAALDVVAEAGADRGRLHEVRAGDELTVGGLDVQVVGEWHSVIHPDLPRGTNVGYLVAGAVLHPGDAFVVPPSGAVVEVALTPVSGPWLRMADAVYWVRSVGAVRAVPIHDAWLSEAGLRSAGDWLARLTSATVVAAHPGEVVKL